MVKVCCPPVSQRDLNRAAKECFNRDWLDTGALVDQFEVDLSHFLGVPREWVMVTNSCTSALATCYKFLVGNAPLGAPVLTWPGTYCAHEGPVIFYDWVEQAQQENIVVVDLFGRLQAECFRPLRSRHKRVILDSAHNLLFDPSFLNHVDAVCLSFGPIKQISTLRGGAIVSPHVNWQWRAYAHYGAAGRDIHLPQGHNYTITDFQAALGRIQIRKFRALQKARMACLEEYERGFKKMNPAEVRLLTTPSGSSGHVCVAAFLTSDMRDSARIALNRNWIQTSHHYPLPRYLPRGMYPQSEAFSDTVLTLPLHHKLTPQHVQDVCNIISSTVCSKRIE